MIQFCLQILVFDVQNHVVSHLVVLLLSVVTVFYQALGTWCKVVNVSPGLGFAAKILCLAMGTFLLPYNYLTGNQWLCCNPWRLLCLCLWRFWRCLSPLGWRNVGEELAAVWGLLLLMQLRKVKTLLSMFSIMLMTMHFEFLPTIDNSLHLAFTDLSCLANFNCSGEIWIRLVGDVFSLGHS